MSDIMKKALMVFLAFVLVFALGFASSFVIRINGDAQALLAQDKVLSKQLDSTSKEMKSYMDELKNTRESINRELIGLNIKVQKVLDKTK